MLILRVACQPSPLGPLVVVESDRGVVAIEMDPARQARLAEHLQARLGKDFVLTPGARCRTCVELGAYFAGKRRRFDVEVDWTSLRGFQKDVLKALSKVPFGERVTYGDLAKMLGKRGAARAVGGALAKNPIPIVLPCHRVIASDGSLGGFSGGAKVKKWLHAHEGIAELAGGWTTRAEREASSRSRRVARQPVKKRRSTRPSRSTTT